jgi:hypothetical protein
MYHYINMFLENMTNATKKMRGYTRRIIEFCEQNGLPQPTGNDSYYKRQISVNQNINVSLSTAKVMEWNDPNTPVVETAIYIRSGEVFKFNTDPPDELGYEMDYVQIFDNLEDALQHVLEVRDYYNQEMRVGSVGMVERSADTAESRVRQEKQRVERQRVEKQRVERQRVERQARQARQARQRDERQRAEHIERLTRQLQEVRDPANRAAFDMSRRRYDLTTEIPTEFICPITMLVMVDPVVANDGNTYERESIEQWIVYSREQRGVAMSPINNRPLGDERLVENRSLRNRIETWMINFDH